MIGFDLIITLDNQGKVTDYKKAYNDFYAKQVKIFLPMKCSKKDYTPYLLTAINETYPFVVEETLGKKSKTDLNCCCFDVTKLYNKYCDDGRIGLSKIAIYDDDSEMMFSSQTFRV